MSTENRPIPFDSKADADRLVELLMPLGIDYGVVSGSSREIEGGWQATIVVTRNRNSSIISKIIDRHARNRDIRITETDSRAVSH